MTSAPWGLDRPVMFTIASAGYTEFVLNLLASLERVGLAGELRVFALDPEAHDRLQAAGVPVEHAPGGPVARWADHGSPEFARAVASKYRIALQFLEKGRWALFVDGDIVVLRDPFPSLAEVVERTGADLLLQWEWPDKAFNTGFWLARPCAPVKGLFGNVLQDLEEGTILCDQESLNGHVPHVPELLAAPLDPEAYACGNQFLRGRTLKEGGIFIDRQTEPFPMDRAVLLHFNFIVGKDVKAREMVRHGVAMHPAVEGWLRRTPGRAAEWAVRKRWWVVREALRGRS